MENTEGKRKFLIATHGRLAGGVKSSLDLITGAMDNVFLIEAYVDENRSIEDDIKAVVDQVGDNDELIVFSDIMGGSVTNQILQYALQSNVHVVSGFNLPLVIEIVLADTDTPAEEVIAEAIENAKQQMVYVNQLLTSQNREEEND
jgi:fructoselysine and glucoselysine-specific PTS system IIA component